MRAQGSEEIEELLQELDQMLARLRLEYEQYFAGAARREPQALRGKVQKVITRFLNEPPRNSGQKFRFNTLNSRFQIYRQLWGRTMREIEAGTYKPHRFRADIHDAVRGSPRPEEITQPTSPGAPRSGLDQLHEALMSARRTTGEPALDREKLSRIVAQQTATLRKQHGQDAKIRFRVVIEAGRARLKASVRSAERPGSRGS
jgi:hypothetical protein